MTPYDLSKGRIVYRFRSDQTIEELEKEKAAKKAEAEEAKENNETTTNPDTDPDPITTPQSST